MDNPASGEHKKNNTSVAAFAFRVRLYRRKEKQRSRVLLPEQKEMIMKRTTTAKTLAIAGITVLALGIVPLARADNKGCTNETLKGAFVHAGTGFTMAGPFAGVGTETFDGDGGITGTGVVSANGKIIPVTVTGTYKVNPDCTGTYTIPGVTTLFFVIADSGNEIHAICIDPGVVLTHVFRRQFPVGDWRQ